MKVKSKVYHYGKMVNPKGGVSALCYDTPRTIDLSKASWVIRPKAVTCKKCLERLKEMKND